MDFIWFSQIYFPIIRIRNFCWTFLTDEEKCHLTRFDIVHIRRSYHKSPYVELENSHILEIMKKTSGEKGTSCYVKWNKNKILREGGMKQFYKFPISTYTCQFPGRNFYIMTHVPRCIHHSCYENKTAFYLLHLRVVAFEIS